MEPQIEMQGFFICSLQVEGVAMFSLGFGHNGQMYSQGLL